MEAKLMKTKKGNGFKIIVGDMWVYAKRNDLYKMLNDNIGTCTFREIEGDGYLEH